MLKGIHPLLGPELLFILASMGHGDVIALVDRNYPSSSTNSRVVRLDGVDCVTAARAIFSVLPLDSFVPAPLARMGVPGDPGTESEVQQQVRAVAEEHEERPLVVEPIERLDFYERVRTVFAVVATGEERPYGCFLLTKGVWPVLLP